MDPDQILREATLPLYLKTDFFHVSTYFKIFKFDDFFSFFVNIGPYGSQNCKRLLLQQIAPEWSQTYEFLSPITSQS